MNDRTRDQLLREFFELPDVHKVLSWVIALTATEKESIKDVLETYMYVRTENFK